MDRKARQNSNSDEAALFREAVAGARPVQAKRLHLRRAPPRAEARFRRRDEATVLRDSLTTGPEDLDLESGEELIYRQPSVRASVLRDLRRGRFPVKAEIDLHGMTSEQARRELTAFIAECVDDGIQCARVVHGKGLRSGHRGPVLKARVNRWLRRWNHVLAFCSAPARDGGTGAIYVLLRR
jgi:DNA-nicking Smr family endonuclease